MLNRVLFPQNHEMGHKPSFPLQTEDHVVAGCNGGERRPPQVVQLETDSAETRIQGFAGGGQVVLRSAPFNTTERLIRAFLGQLAGKKGFRGHRT